MPETHKTTCCCSCWVLGVTQLLGPLSHSSIIAHFQNHCKSLLIHVRLLFWLLSIFFSFFFSTAQHSTVIHFSTRSQAPWRLGAVSHVIFISLGQLQFFQNSSCGDYHILLKKKKHTKNGTKEQENETSVLSFLKKNFYLIIYKLRKFKRICIHIQEW